MIKLDQIRNYFKEVKIEMSKVNWPSKNQTKDYTLVVIGASLTVAIFLGFLDYVFGLGLNIFLFK